MNSTQDNDIDNDNDFDSDAEASQNLAAWQQISDPLGLPLNFGPIFGLHEDWQNNETETLPSSVPSMAVWGITKEQLDLFQVIIESCTDVSAARRATGLEIMSSDPRVDGAMPMLAPFIADTVSFNVAEENMEFIVYMLRMINALLTNDAVDLDKYVHLLLPAVLACMLSDQICANPGAEDHWRVRKFANDVASDIVWRFSCTLPTIIESYKDALLDEALTTVYGGIIGLGKMGQFAIRIWLLPQLKHISGRIEPHLNGDREYSSVSINTVAAKFIRHELAEVCGPVLQKIHSQYETPGTYTEAYGFLGPALYAAVILLRLRPHLTDPAP